MTNATMLFFVVQRRNDDEAVQICRLLCDELQAVDPAGADKHGQTALFFAARDGNLKCVEWLVQGGSDVNRHDTALQTALFYAARDGRTNVVKHLIENNADVNAVDNLGQTALFYACRDGRAQTVELMLAKGAKSNIKDKFKKLPWTYAMRNGHKDLAMYVKSYIQSAEAAEPAPSTVPAMGQRKKYRLHFRPPFDDQLWLLAPKSKIKEFEDKFPEIAVWYKDSEPPPITPNVDPFRAAWQKVAMEIINEVSQYEGGWVFTKPVDAKAWNCPDYHQIIKYPMDISTVKKKLKAFHYRKCQDFVNDVEQIFSNCKAYNKPESSVAKVGRNVEQYFRNLVLRKGLDMWINRQTLLDEMENNDTDPNRGAAEVSEKARPLSDSSDESEEEEESKRKSRRRCDSPTAGGGKVFPDTKPTHPDTDSDERMSESENGGNAKIPKIEHAPEDESEDDSDNERLFTPPNEINE
eukprot:GHVO01040425.1.p1 GENE.GHVO01040425.1~~GHVO01040425.1.p1  ORF type:complete len:509 (+),score=91.25 GHVO01040425.1:130-1527(+)